MPYGSEAPDFFENSQVQPLKTPLMAGYIDALYPLCAVNPGNLFSNILFNGDVTDPRAQIAIRCFMQIVGSDDFNTALQAENKGPSPCGLFTALYGFLTDTTYTFVDPTPPIPPAAQPTSLLDLCQKFFGAGGQVAFGGGDNETKVHPYYRMMLGALADVNSPLPSVVGNIGQAPSPGGYSGSVVGAYSPIFPGNALTLISTCLTTFITDIGNSNVAGALRQIAMILKPSMSVPLNDPTYSLVLAVLTDFSFNGDKQAGYSASLADIAKMPFPLPVGPPAPADVLKTDLTTPFTGTFPSTGIQSYQDLLAGLASYIINY